MATNWAGGAIPDASTTALMGAGKYVVTLEGSSQAVGALQVGSGVTFNISQQDGDASTSLNIGADSINNGTIGISGSAIFLSDGATLVNYGELYGGNGVFTPSVQSGHLLNEGLISGSSGVGSSILLITSDVENDIGGVVNTRATSRVTFLGAVQNDGLLSATEGGLINFKVSGAIGSTLNLGEGVLTGGHWAALGNGSTLNLYNSEIIELAGGAVVTLSGAGSQMGGESNSGVTSIETSLKTLDDGTELHILGGRSYYTGQDVDIGGLLELGGGTFNANTILVHDDVGSSLAGYGVVAGDMDMYGLLRAAKTKDGQTLDLHGYDHIYGSTGGKGTLEISAGFTVLEAGSQVFVKDILVDSENGLLWLHQNLVYDGKLEVSDGGDVTLSNNILRLTGKLTLDSGTIDTGQLQLEGGTALVTGTSYDYADLRNDGSVTIKDHLAQFGAVNGTGEFHLLGGASLTLGDAVTSGQTFYLDGAHTTVAFNENNTFRGAVSGFGAGDTLMFLRIDGAGASLSWKADDAGGGTLTLVSGSEKTSTHLLGTYQKSQFHLSTETGVMGVQVTYGSTAGAEPHGHEAGAWDAQTWDATAWDAHGGLAI